MVENHDLALSGAQEFQDSPIVEMVKRAGNGLERKSQIVGDIAAAHWKRNKTGPRQSTVHFEQEGRHPLQRGFAAQSSI